MDECPAGGPHVWTDDVDERFTTRGSLYYTAPADRWHCDHCGTPRPKPEPDPPVTRRPDPVVWPLDDDQPF